MSSYAFRLRLLTTFAVLMTMLMSAGVSRPLAAQPMTGNKTTQEPGVPTAQERSDVSAKLASAFKRNNNISYNEPKEPQLLGLARNKLGPNASQAQVEAEAAALLKTWRETYYHGPDPQAYQKLLRNEQRALAAGKSPQALGLGVTGTLRVLTLAVEFAGTDTAENFSHPVSAFNDRTCITDTVTFTGPLHNEIPEPGPRDNNTFWRPNFDRKHYEDLVFSETGITERVRPDLTDPEDGKPGIDISGASMANYYKEVSGGRVNFDGGPRGVVAWIQVPHSQAYYGATACADGDPGDNTDMDGLPQNPRFGNGPAQLLVDAVDQINATDPNFPWADYDTDGDGVIDRVVIFHAGEDKSQAATVGGYEALWGHRGIVDPSAGGYLADDRGTADPSDDVRLLGYAMQEESSGLGVLVHEFGHDLGLPDLYDTSDLGESDVVWWDLMSTGSHTGKLFQSEPTHMSAWSKWALGWTDPQDLEPTSAGQEVVLGQTSRPPAGTTQAVKVDLPPTELQYTELLTGSTQAWWSNNDQNWADVRLSREVNLTGQTAPISISFDIDWAIEADWDYLFLEVSTDGGRTWTQTPGYEVGTDVELTTPEDYADPNGRLGDYGDLKYGYTGFTADQAQNLLGYGGWARAYHTLDAYAGQNITLRFRYATDAAFLERGAFIDNIVISSASGTILNDPVEATNGWTPTVGTFTSASQDPLGAGWILSNGTQLKPKYYLLEWRNLDGFDEGLKYTYNTVFLVESETGSVEWQVDKVPSNVPGMLVWVRDTRYGNDPLNANNQILNHMVDPPSEGPKGGLLVVDSHYEPLRGPRDGTLAPVDPLDGDEYGPFPYPPANNWSGRVQTTNAAFNLQSTPSFGLRIADRIDEPEYTRYRTTNYGPMEGVAGFHDSLGYYPGVETLPEPIKTVDAELNGATVVRIKPYAFKDPDASVVVPAKGYYPPRTPSGFTGLGGETSPPSANVSTFETMIAERDGIVNYVSIGEASGDPTNNVTGRQTGNPGDYGVQFGYHFEVIAQASDGTSGTIRLSNRTDAAEGSGRIDASSGTSQPATVTLNVKNVGSPAVVAAYSDFDETQAALVSGSLSRGAIPVRVSREKVKEVVQSQGAAGLQALAVPVNEATAIAWASSGNMGSGEAARLSYKLSRKGSASTIRVVNTIMSSSFTSEFINQTGTFFYLPLIQQ